MTLAARTAVVVSLAILLTGAGTAGLAIAIGHSTIRSSALAAVEAGAEATGRGVAAYLVDARTTMETIASLAASIGPLPASGLAGREEAPSLRAALDNLAEGDARFEFVALLRPSGAVLLVEPAAWQENLAGPEMTFYSWFQDLQANGVVVSDLHVSTVTHRTSVVVGVAMRDALDRTVGYVVGGLRLSGLLSLVSNPSGDFFGYITDGRGLLVAHGRDPRLAQAQTDFSQVPAVKLALGGSSGTIESRNPIENEDRLGAYRWLPDLGWTVVYVVPSEAAYAPAWSMALIIGAATAFVIGGFGLVAVPMTRRVTEPVRRLSLAATALAAGERNVLLPRATGDEIGQLSRDFGHLIEVVDAREADLRSVADELRESNSELEAFIYSASHDLRSPLRTIDGFSRVLLDEYAAALDAEGRRLLDKIVEGSGQMASLIDNLLALSQTSRTKPEIREVKMNPLVEGVLAELRTQEPDRDVSVTVGDLADVRADPVLLGQVWANLLGNAWKFTRHVPGAAVDVWSEAGSGEQRFLVRDNGAGFEPEYASSLFMPFRRLHRADEFEGNGIGLAIVARIISRYGGHVWADGRPGRGATFGFSLPTERGPA